MQRFAIHGVPRSGTTWLGELVNSSPAVRYHYQPLFSHGLKGYLDENSDRARIGEFFRILENHEDPFTLQLVARAESRLPEFRKNGITHIGYKEVRYHHILGNLLTCDSEIKVVLLTRGPMAVISSWLGAPREFRRDLGWDELVEWRDAPKKNLGRTEEYNGYEKWKEATMMFHRLALAHPSNALLVNYDHLVANPEKLMGECFDFLGLPFSDQSRDFIAGRFRGVEDSYSVFREKQLSGSAAGRLDPRIVDAIREDLAGSALESYLEMP